MLSPETKENPSGVSTGRVLRPKVTRSPFGQRVIFVSALILGRISTAQKDGHLLSVEEQRVIVYHTAMRLSTLICNQPLIFAGLILMPGPIVAATVQERIY